MNTIYFKLEVLFGLTLLWGIYWFAIRELALDRMRQRLFQIRSELFDQVADGALPLHFSDLEYVEVRRYINRIIRYGYRISVLKIIIFRALSVIPWLRSGYSYSEINTRPQLLIDQIENGDHADVVKKYKLRIYRELSVYFCFTSPIFFIVFSGVTLGILLYAGLSMWKSVLSTAGTIRFFETEFDGEICDLDDDSVSSNWSGRKAAVC